MPEGKSFRFCEVPAFTPFERPSDIFDIEDAVWTTRGNNSFSNFQNQYPCPYENREA